jgi:RimJ/RimL family protein N-acetyltransferase
VTVAPSRRPASPLRVRLLRPRDREGALVWLGRDARANLLLIDAVRQIGRSPVPGEARAEVVVAHRGGELVGVAALQPILAAAAGDDVFEAFLPYVRTLGAGLVKTAEPEAARLWAALAAAGRRALLDRFESGYAVGAGEGRFVEPPPGARVRPAEPRDLSDLVEAARASLREESRPDPFEGDPVGFRRWVAGRVGRATVVEWEGRPAFVAYADIQSSYGWLVQGVYTWPRRRRLGLAAAGMSALCRRAFAAGAEHVQLAVVEGNAAAEGLYERLGFRRFARLRTVLFA